VLLFTKIYVLYDGLHRARNKILWRMNYVMFLFSLITCPKWLDVVRPLFQIYAEGLVKEIISD